jgi:regulator of protease activity HflC (stomatin/prohibitin superfamily)
MKKLLTVLALIAFTGSVFAANAFTKFTNSVNSGLNKATQAEQNLNNKIDQAQADRAKAKAEQEKKIAAKKAEAQAKADAQKKAYNDTKKAVDNEVSFWKSLKFWK